MLDKLIEKILHNRLLVIVVFLLVFGSGLLALIKLPVDAFPDTTPVQVQINTVAPSLGPEEIEKQLSLPFELAISGLPGLLEVRSISKFGLSQVVAIFDDNMAILDSRQLIVERLAGVALPDGVDAPELGPISTGLGEVFHYILRSDNPNRTLADLRTLHDWVVKRELRKVPGVAEVNSWGGKEKQYHVIADPNRLIKYGFTLDDVATALQENNTNVGGGVVETGGQALLVHGLGRVITTGEIGAIVIDAVGGVPIRVRDVAEVVIDSEIRRGAVSAGGRGEVVLGLGFMLMGENSRNVTIGLKNALERVAKTLPEDVVLETVYDRTDLIDQVIETVEHNLVAGAILVIAVLFILLGNLRAGLLVASTIPMAMLFAALGMQSLGITASLLSLGAIDFGILVDGSVVMTEANLRRLTATQLQLQRPLTAAERFNVIVESSREVLRPILFGMLIIVIVFLPVLTLEGIEGKMFSPMALTFIVALLGALLVAVFLNPVLSYFFLPKQVKVRKNLLDAGLKRVYGALLERVLAYRKMFLVAVAMVLVATISLSVRLGGEFLPKMSEGSLVISVVRLAGVSVEESIAYNSRMEALLMESFPDEVRTVWSRLGSAETATDPMGTELTDMFLALHPKEQWVKAQNQAELTQQVKNALEGLPGIRSVLTQPIELRVNEMISGLRSDVGINIIGDNFDQLVNVGENVRQALVGIDGAADVEVEQITGQPTLEIKLNRQALARYGVAAKDVLDMVSAVGTPQVGEIYEGERSFPLVLRLPDTMRHDVEALANVLIPTRTGAVLPMKELATLKVVDRPSTINREWGKRLIKVQVNVRGRDIASFVDEARQKVADEVALPEGYMMEWGGQFENLERSQKRLAVVVPITLLLIFVLLFFSLKRLSDVLIIYTGIPMAAIGGVVMLYSRNIPFSVSAAIGFIALSGIAVLNGQVLISAIRSLVGEGMAVQQAVMTAAKQRLIPVLATAITDAVGFLPMALSVGVGAEVQRPLASVVVGGVLTSTLLTLFVLPSLYLMVNGRRQGSAE